MAHKRLSAAQIHEMKTMVSQGVSPEDIAKHFEIATSSVHNYKKRFKEEGLKYPSVRGRRPSGSVEQPRNFVESKQNNVVSKSSNGVNLVVNGVSVQVSSQAKNIMVGENSIEIKF